MTLLDLVAMLRRRLNDTGGDKGPPPVGYRYYWEADDTTCLLSNDDCVDFINEAEREFCRRRPLLGEREFWVGAGTSTYWLDDNVLAVRWIRAKADGRAIRRITREERDRAPVVATPCSVYLEEPERRRIELLAVPTTAETLVLAVEMLPDEPMTWACRDDCPTVEEPWHATLVDHAAHLAYRVRDFDTHDPVAAERSALAFDRAVGPPRPAPDIEWRRRLADRNPRARATFF